MLRVLVRRLPGMHKAWSPPSPVPSKSAIPALGQSSLPVESRVSLGHGKVKPCSLKKKKKKVVNKVVGPRPDSDCGPRAISLQD